MKGPVLRLVLVLAALVVLAAPGVASAATRTQILGDCEDDDRLSGTYTPRELRDARDNVPTDKAIYTKCADILRSALQASARGRAGQSGASGGGASGDPVSGGTAAGGGGSGASGGSGLDLNRLDTETGARNSPVASPEDLKELRAARENLPEVDVRGQRVVPGVQGVAGQAASATVPTPLVVVLVLLGVTAALALVPLVRRRVLGRRAG